MAQNITYFTNKESLKFRITGVVIFFASIILFYSVYLFSLQVVKGFQYKERAWAVARRESLLPTLRGEIYDRNYDLQLVANVDSFAVEIIPAEMDIKKNNEVIKSLANILEIDEEDIRKKIPSKIMHQYNPVEIKDNIKYEKIIMLAENIEKLPGVTWRSKPVRSYIDSGSIAHILGFVGEITQDELQVLYNKGYTLNAALGKSGIEKEYDLMLRGKHGYRYNTVDVKGKRVASLNTEEVLPVIGKTVVLTIDKHIQTLCEKALGERMGSVIAMKPNGEILAMVSYPWYNPNNFYGSENSNYYKTISLDPKFPFLNRAIQSSYSPGSVFKVIMTTALLEEGVFSPYEKIECKGNVTLGNRVFNCHVKTGHGWLNLAGGLAESCDIYFWTVGMEYLGIDRIAEYSRIFGLGQKSGIDIPGEEKGLVPTPEWKTSTFNVPWVGGDTFNISIGQGYLETTPLQMANAIAFVVNDGVNYVPHVLKEIKDPTTGEIIQTFESKVLSDAAGSIKKETFRKVKEYMRGVITHGTARVVITTKAAQVAGKTGTAEVGYKDKWSSWFSAYAPYDSANPDDQVIVVVMVEATNDWEWWAPKASNVIFQGIFAKQTYEEAVDALNIWYLRKPKDVVTERVE